MTDHLSGHEGAHFSKCGCLLHSKYYRKSLIVVTSKSTLLTLLDDVKRSLKPYVKARLASPSERDQLGTELQNALKAVERNCHHVDKTAREAAKEAKKRRREEVEEAAATDARARAEPPPAAQAGRAPGAGAQAGGPRAEANTANAHAEAGAGAGAAGAGAAGAGAAGAAGAATGQPPSTQYLARTEHDEIDRVIQAILEAISNGEAELVTSPAQLKDDLLSLRGTMRAALSLMPDRPKGAPSGRAYQAVELMDKFRGLGKSLLKREQ
jgi:hypothetical protein